MVMEMRRLITHPWTVHYTDIAEWKYDGGTDSFYGEFDILSEYNRMSVDRGPKSSKFAIRALDHVLMRTTNYSPMRVKKEFANRYEYVTRDFRPFDLGSQALGFVAQVNDSIAAWQPDVDTLVDRYVDDVYQPPSLINFALELDDFPQMWDDLTSGLRWATSRRGQRYLTRQYVNGRRLVRSRDGRIRSRRALRLRNDVVDPLSSAVLTTNLGVLPASSDVMGLLDLGARYMADYRRIRHLMTRPGGTPITWKRKAPYTLSGDYGWCKYDISGTYLKRFGARVTATFPQGDPFTGLDTWAASGLNFDLQTVWNAVPFSFLIDYFVPVGEALRRSRIFSDLQVHDMWVTTEIYGSATFSSDTSLVGTSASGEVIQNGTWSFDFRSYYRQPLAWDVPDQISVRDVSLIPSGRSLSNLAAFANQVFRR